MKQLKETIAIIGEGITERYYIESIKDCVQIKPKSIQSKNSSIKEIEIKIKECIADGFSKIICLIDMDTKANDGIGDHVSNRNQYIKLKNKYHNKYCNKTKDDSFVLMIESFPCIEVFFLYYFQYTSASHTNDGLKKLLKDKYGYLTSEKYLMRNSLLEVFECQGGSLKNAIRNSTKSISSIDENNPHCVYTEIGKIFELLKLKE